MVVAEQYSNAPGHSVYKPLSEPTSAETLPQLLFLLRGRSEIKPERLHDSTLGRLVPAPCGLLCRHYPTHYERPSWSLGRRR